MRTPKAHAKVWGLTVRGTLRGWAERTRDDVRLRAGQTMMYAGKYTEICERTHGHERAMALWDQVKKFHPTAKIIRVYIHY